MGSILRNCDGALRRAWHPLCRSHDVDDQPTSFRLLGVSYVAYRTRSGVHVFEDRCPHRFAPLSAGHCEGDTLQCGYHGWRFDDTGRCVEIPALGDGAVVPSRATLRPPAGLFESHGMVFIAPSDPLTPRPVVEAANDPKFQRGDLPILETRGSVGLLADNFLDVAHFPFVHAATFGTDEARRVPHFEVVRDGYTFRASFEHSFLNREDPGVAQGVRPLLQRRRLTYRYTAPFHLELEIEFLDTGGINVIGFFLTPLDDDHVRVYSSLWRNDLDGSEEKMADAIKFEVAVVEEDFAVQSRYERLELPLDVTAELHTRADRVTLELRRVLGDLVVAARG